MRRIRIFWTVSAELNRGSTPTSTPATGLPLVHLANIAARVGRQLHFDSLKEEIVGDADANQLLHRKYREHQATPHEARG